MGTSYIRVSLVQKVVSFALSFVFLRLLACCSCNFVVVNLALAVLAIPVSGVILAFLWRLRPRQFIPNLTDKAVVITGCDTGFGNSLAKSLDKKGVTVYAGCLFPGGEAATELKIACSSNLHILPLDVTSDEQVREAVESVSTSLGDKKLLAVVNNAGIAGVGEVEWFPLDNYHRIMEVNTFGVIRVTQAFLPLLRKTRGRVVIVSSYLGRITLAGTSAYCMSKYAAVSLTDSLRRELMKWSISVHSVEPWLYRTDMTSSKHILRGVEKTWDEVSPSVRTDYGESYIDNYKMSLTKILGTGRPASETREVVADMVHATIGRDPKLRYSPGLVGQIWTWISAYIPQEFVDFLQYIVYPRIHS